MTKIPPSISPSNVPAQPRPAAVGPTPNLLQLGPNYNLAADGADKFGRFRYQATCAAIYGLTMLDDGSEHEKLYCETLEDFTMQRKDGKLTSVQVKSRDKGLDPLKTSDTEVLSSLHRFAEYETKDASSFSRYVIATNIGFWRGRKDWYNLTFLQTHTKELASDEEMEGDGEIRKAREALTKHKRDIAVTMLRNVFDKLLLHDRLPDMKAAQAVLGDELKKRCGNSLTVDEFDAIVSHLIEFFCRFSSRALEDVTGTTQVLADDPEAAVGAMRMESRTVTPEMLRQHIDEGIEKAQQCRRMREEVNEEAQSAESAVSFPSLTGADVESAIRNAMDSIQRLREQFEWEKVNSELDGALAQLDLYSNLAPSTTAFDLFMLGAEVEAENANRSDETGRQRHIGKAQWCIRKAREIRDR